MSVLLGQDTTPPSVHVIYPDDGTFSSCSFGDILIYAYDESTIERESLFLTCTVGGIPYELHDSVVSILDTLVYFPYPVTVSHGDTIELLLAPIRDFPFGNAAAFISWEFYIDQIPPDIDLIYPTPGEEIDEVYPDIQIALYDDMSGVSLDSSYITINGIDISLSDSAVTRSGDTFTLSLFDYGMPLPGGNTVSICIHSADNAIACGANRQDSCFIFTIEPGGPVAELISPYDRASVSCLDTGVIISVFDEDGILEDSLRMVIDGADTLFTGDAGLSWDGNILLLPTILHGTHEYEVLAWDSLLNPLEEPLIFELTGDTICPDVTIESPPEGEILTIDPVFRFRVTDNHSLVFSSPTMFIVRVSGVHDYDRLFTLAAPELVRIGEIFRLDLSGYEFQGGDTIDVSVTVYDSVNICAPNGCTYNFSYYIPYSPPSTSVRTPPIGSVISCDSTEIIVRVFDDQPIDPSSINFRVGGVLYTIADDELEFVDDSLIIFTPSEPWADGTIVRCRIEDVADILGNNIETDHAWGFTVDLSGPEIRRTFPMNLQLVVDTTADISLWFRDDISGIDESSISISVDGITYDYPHPQLFWDSGVLEFSPTEGWDEVDTVEVCLLSAYDTPDPLCPPNGCDCPDCFTFFVDARTPFVTPSDNSITACDSQTVEAYLWSPLGISPLSIEFVVNGVSYTTADPELWFSEDTLHFGPSIVPWEDGEWVECSLASASDGLTEIEPFGWRFLVDLSSPIFSDASPVGEVSERTPDISFDLFDETSGLDSMGVELYVGGVRFSLTSEFISMSGSEIIFDLEAAVAGGLLPLPVGGDTIEVRLIAPDNAPPERCGPNELDTTWTFYIEYSPPVVTHLYPDIERNTSCLTAEGQRVAILLEDDNGINTEELLLTINGISYDIDSPELVLIGDTLIWTPLSVFPGGTVLNVTLSTVFDILGSPAPGYSFSITVDNSPPLVMPLFPEPRRVIADSMPDISAIVMDSLSGFGWEIVGDSPLFERQSGDTLFFVLPEPTLPEDTVEICLALWDSTANCPANTDTFCWFFLVDVVPPTIRAIRPEDSLFASCERDTLVFLLSDVSGVLPTSIILTHNDEEFRISSPELRYIEDTLYFVPSGGWVHGDTVHVDITNAEDIAGNSSSYENILTFFIDQMPPVTDVTPMDGSVLLSRSPSFGLFPEDVPAGLDSSTFSVNIDGTVLFLGDEGLYADGDSIVLDLELAGIEYTAGDSFCIVVSASDMIALCDPNAMDTSFCFSISYTPPILDAIFPSDSDRISCTDTSIFMEFTDADGLGDSLILTFNGDEYIYGDAGVLITTETITLSGIDFLEENEFCIEYAEDALGAPLDDLPFCITFYQDTTPPSFAAFPPESMLTSDPSPEITVTFSDPSGAYPDSISFGGIWYSGGEYFEIMDDVMQLSFPEGDTIDTGWVEVCVAAHDSAMYCGVNRLLDCYYFYINISAPQPLLQNPFDGAVTSCPDNEIVIFMRDDDGILESSVLLTVNDTPYRLTSPELSLLADTLRFVPGTWDAESIYVTLEAEDLLGNAISPPYAFHFFVDTIPPEIVEHIPMDGEMVASHTHDVLVVVDDNRAGVDTERMTITVGDSLDIEGIWTDSLFTFASPYFLERDTVNITAHSYFDTPDICPPNQGEPYMWSFVIADDDTLPPVFVNTNEVGYCGRWVHITEEITDSSGIMDGSVFITVWDDFGDTLVASGTMEGDGIYTSVDSFFLSEILYYSVTATDNDFDDEIEIDRITFTAIETLTCNPLDLPILPGMTGEIGDTCVGDTLTGRLGFVNIHPDPVELDTLFLTNAGFFTVGEISGGSLSPGDTLWLDILFHPEEEMAYLDTLLIYGNGLLLPSVELEITAMGMECIKVFSILPNPFTPNGDGYNDEIIVQIPEKGPKELLIFDTRNTLIYQRETSEREIRWDGRTDSGKDAAAGSYIYVILEDGKKYKTGVITLAR